MSTQCKAVIDYRFIIVVTLPRAKESRTRMVRSDLLKFKNINLALALKIQKFGFNLTLIQALIAGTEISSSIGIDLSGVGSCRIR